MTERAPQGGSPAKRRTYWHLEEAKRKPTEYEVVTSRLLYHVERGLEVDVPVGGWNRTYQRGSALRCKDWERFYDPRETTYAKYNELQSTKQIYTDGLLGSIDDAYERGLSVAWLEVLERVMAPLLYPMHGLEMVCAYVGHMAPGGRVAVACLFQAADEMRRVQVLAYRTRQVQLAHPGFAESSKAIWERDAMWQPWRELVERLLVTYDWGEAFVALNLVAKPAFDDLFMKGFARLSKKHVDDVLAKLLASLDEDCSWHRDWSRALVDVVVADDPRIRDVIQSWAERWRPHAARAVLAFGSILEEDALHG